MGEDNGQAPDTTDARRIDGRDVGGDGWYALRPGPGTHAVALGAICVIQVQAEEAWLDPSGAAGLASFLLSAAGPDAAREALVKFAPWPFESETPLETTARLMREKNAAEARAERAEKRLAAVLAVPKADLLNMLAAHLGHTTDPDTDEELADAILDLINSRARVKTCNECGDVATKHSASLGTFCDDCAPPGAEEPTGGTT